MIALFIILGIIILVILILFVITISVNLKAFNFHLDKVKNVKYFDAIDFVGLKKEEYSFNYNKKTVIRGAIYYYGSKENKDIAIFFHGYNSGMTSYGTDIERIARNNYVVISYNVKGAHDSDGKLGGLIDSLKVAKKFESEFLSKSEFKDRNLVLMGHSWGAYTAINASRYFKNVKKIVAISSFSNPAYPQFGNSLLVKILIPFFYIINLVKYGSLANISSYKTLKKINIKTMLLHGEIDHLVQPIQSSSLYKKIKNDNVKLIVYKGKKHSPQLSFEAQEALTEFLKETANKKEIDKEYDFKAMCELDEDVMNDIFSFLKD